MQANSGDPDQTTHSGRLIWVCTICLCPTKRTLGIYGLNANILIISLEFRKFGKYIVEIIFQMKVH